MAWRRPGDKPLSERMMVRLLTRHQPKNWRTGLKIEEPSEEEFNYFPSTIWRRRKYRCILSKQIQWKGDWGYDICIIPWKWWANFKHCDTYITLWQKHCITIYIVFVLLWLSISTSNSYSKTFNHSFYILDIVNDNKFAEVPTASFKTPVLFA